MAGQEWFADRRVFPVGLVSVDPRILSQAGFEAIAHERSGLLVRLACKFDVKAHLATNPARMLSKGAKDAVASLDRTLREEIVAALRAKGSSFLFHFFDYKPKQLQR